MSLQGGAENIRKGIDELDKAATNSRAMFDYYRDKRSHVEKARELLGQATALMLLGTEQEAPDIAEQRLESTALAAEFGIRNSLDFFTKADLDKDLSDDATEAMRLTKELNIKGSWQVRAGTTSYLEIQGEVARTLAGLEEQVARLENQLNGMVRDCEPLPELAQGAATHAGNYLRRLT